MNIVRPVRVLLLCGTSLFIALLGAACAHEAEPVSPPGLDVEAPPTSPPPPSPAVEPRRATAKERAFCDRLTSACIPCLEELARDPGLVDAVARANRTNHETQVEILAKDQNWRRANGAADPLIAPYLNNPCAQLLREVQKTHPEYAELFTMDALGCIVAATDKTSDYWQGDEAKWTESYHGGVGKVFVDEIQYDHSSQAYVVQISLPVRGHDGKAIGAMTVSVLARQGR